MCIVVYSAVSLTPTPQVRVALLHPLMKSEKVSTLNISGKGEQGRLSPG